LSTDYNSPKGLNGSFLPVGTEIMAEYKVELVRKIVRMAESDHDGEIASAMRKLVGMAKEQGHNLDEMLVAVYGGARPGNGDARPFTRETYQGRRARDPYANMWDDLMRQAREHAARADREHAAKTQREAQAARDRASADRQRQHDEAEERRRRAEEKPRQYQAPPWDEDPPWMKARRGDYRASGFDPGGKDETFTWSRTSSAGGFFEPLLQRLSELFALYGAAPLTQWEINFVSDITNRGKDYQTSPAQDDVIKKIIEKYVRWPNRNGDEESFWRA
jgi:hypothetical protein